MESILYISRESEKMKTYFLEFAKGICNICKWGYYQPRKFLVDDRKKIVYLVMPKVANTSIEASFLHYQGEDYVEVHYLASESEKPCLNKKERKFFKFTYVRNPFERLVSCYENKYHSDKNYVEKTQGHRWFDNYLFGYMSNDEGFDVFVKKIYKIPNRLRDFHFLPQYDILYDKRGNKLVDYIGRIDQIEETYPPIQKKYRLAQLKHFNQIQKQNWMDYYTVETARMAYKIYKKDVDALGYKKEYRELIRYLKSKEEHVGLQHLEGKTK